MKVTNHKSRLGWTIGFGAALLAGFSIAAMSTTKHSSISDEAETFERILTVDTLAVHSATGYTVQREFIGRVEARRESAVGFELAGLVGSLHADEGDLVEAGQILAELDTQLLQAARAELAANRDRVRADLKLAEGTRLRVREARKLNAVSSQEWDEADRNYTAKLAAFDQADSSLREIDLRIAKSRLQAPFKAWIARRYLDEGAVIASGTPVFRVLEYSEPEARIGVAGPATEGIRPDDRYRVRVGHRSIPATVRSVLPVRKPNTRSVEVILRLHTDFDSIRSGDLVALTIDRWVDSRGFWVPLDALTESARGLWAVYEVNAPEGSVGILSRRELEVLYQTDGRVFVRGDLSDGVRIVRGGLHRLVPQQRVHVVAFEARG